MSLGIANGGFGLHSPSRARLRVFTLMLLTACSHHEPANTSAAPAAAPVVHIEHNPYAGVDWSRDQALLTQFHEHVRTNLDAIRKMDDAGYNAVSVFNYSGVASNPAAWTERHWPPERDLPAEFLAKLKHIRLFFPNAEEVGFAHVTSPFLTQYIAKWEPGRYAKFEPWHYDSTQSAIDVIRKFGGLPFIAHPWGESHGYRGLRGFAGMELYNAYCRHKFEIGVAKLDRNVTLRSNWDAVLEKNPAVLGIAVNDWFGIFSDDPRLRPATRDSGKAIVLVKDATLAGLRDAIERGAVFAVQDFGAQKNHFPRLQSIAVGPQSIRLEPVSGTVATVRWVADGRTLSSEAATLDLTKLRPRTRYVRAELEAPDGSTLFTQAFGLKWEDGSGKRPEKRHRHGHHSRRSRVG